MESALDQLVNAIFSLMALTGSSFGAATDLINTNAFGSGSNFQNMIGVCPAITPRPIPHLVWQLFDSGFNLVKTGNRKNWVQGVL